jgi:GH15 family glucan-1,4-alpha-glucosidase
MLDRTDDAIDLFNRLLDLRNDLGLLAEQYDPSSGRQLGNYPQAFSHVALVTSATRLARRWGADERSPNAADDGDGDTDERTD